MNIIGLDLSLTATGVATSHTCVNVIRPKTRGMNRLDDIRQAVIEFAVDADAVYLEGYAFGRPNQAHYLGELGGLVRWTLWVGGVPYYDVPPKSLKKFAAGNGNAGKPDMLDAARREGYEGSNDNNCVDAWWLRQFGLYAANEPGVAVFAYRDDAVAACTKENAA